MAQTLRSCSTRGARVVERVRRRGTLALAGFVLLGVYGTLGSARATQADVPDFERVIAPMIARCCISCHRADGPGAYPFRTAGEVQRAARTALQAIEANQMPPWAPSAGAMSVPPRFTTEELTQFRAWVEAGAAVDRADFVIDLPIADTTASPTRVIASWRIGESWTIDAEERSVMRSFQQPLMLERAIHAVNIDAPAQSDRTSLLIGGWRTQADAPGLLSTVWLTAGSREFAQALDARDASIGFKFTGDLGVDDTQRDSTGGALAGVGIDGAFMLPAGCAMMIHADDALVAECHGEGRGRRESGEFTLFALAPNPQADQPLRVVSPLVVSANGAARTQQIGARTVNETPPLTKAMDLAAMVLRPGPDAVRVELMALLPNAEPLLLLRIDRYDIHTDRPYMVDPLLSLPIGTRLLLTVDARNEILAQRATAQAVLLLTESIARDDLASVAATQNDPPSKPIVSPLEVTAVVAPKTLEPHTRAWLDAAKSFEYQRAQWTATSLVDAQTFRELLGYEAPPPTGTTDAAGMTWFEAIALANELSRRDGFSSAYEVTFAQFEQQQLVSAVVRTCAGNGWQLPSDTQWSESAQQLGVASSGALWNWTWDTAGTLENNRVVRGGCWGDPAETRGIAAKSAVAPATRSELFGARFVRELPAR